MPKTMLTLMEIVTKFCSGEDEWYAKQKAHDGDPSMSGTKDEIGKPKRNCKNKHKDYNDGDDQINASGGTRAKTAVHALTISWIGLVTTIGPRTMTILQPIQVE